MAIVREAGQIVPLLSVLEVVLSWMGDYDFDGWQRLSSCQSYEHFPSDGLPRSGTPRQFGAPPR